MQKIATRIFTYASVAFGFLGIVLIVISPERDADMSDFNRLIMKLWMISIFTILTSFALSVAGKYLNDKS